MFHTSNEVLHLSYYIERKPQQEKKANRRYLPANYQALKKEAGLSVDCVEGARNKKGKLRESEGARGTWGPQVAREGKGERERGVWQECGVYARANSSIGKRELIGQHMARNPKLRIEYRHPKLKQGM
ncbi:hypothetical protein P5673_010144 [Acropora cervicornis]|uniref:Uncharacterized protein n=1 Tax=Acropora cervicornis TaxID=6130 RepID=A0AAD9QR33_ACRCE|nr:hypothetical protein P5673_010144 [Acropora cervicornis]